MYNILEQDKFGTRKASNSKKSVYFCTAMKVFNDLNNLPHFKKAVVTIGSFDGVHRGHQKIIEKLNDLARTIGGESIIITFHPHPRLVVYPDEKSLQLITTIEEKIQLFETYGVGNVVVIPFTKEFSRQSPDEYIRKFLLGKFDPAYIVIGYDHRFGLNRQGNINYLKSHAKQQGFEVVEIEKQQVEYNAVSSTKIRLALEKGDVPTASRLLNHPFSLTGTVVHGQKIGEGLGFPTANIEVSQKHKLIPPYGIYAVFVTHQKRRYGGMLYIGNRPTLDHFNNQTIEVHIFDFNKNIYGDKLKIELVAYIRDDARFENLDELKTQLAEDEKIAALILQEKTGLEEREKTENLPSVAVVILNFNGKPYLEKFLPSVQDSSYPNYKIYIADNGSNDDSHTLIREHYPKICWIELQTNHGFAMGYNLALSQIEADYFVLLNSDIEVCPGWIEPIITAMEEDKTIGACQPKIKSFEQKDFFEYAGACGGWLDALGYPFCRGRIFAVTEKDQGQYNDIQEIFWATGAAFFIRARLFLTIDGFDEDYFAHSEEIDLCWRIKRAGYKILVCPESVVYHIGGGTLAYVSSRKTYLNFRNGLYTLLKNENAGKLVWLIPLRLALDGLAGLLFFVQGKFKHIASIINAHWAFYFNFSKMLRKRKIIKEKIDKLRISTGPKMEGRYQGSIVWQYYARGKTYFRQLK